MGLGMFRGLGPKLHKGGSIGDYIGDYSRGLTFLLFPCRAASFDTAILDLQTFNTPKPFLKFRLNDDGDEVSAEV